MSKAEVALKGEEDEKDKKVVSKCGSGSEGEEHGKEEEVVEE